MTLEQLDAVEIIVAFDIVAQLGQRHVIAVQKLQRGVEFACAAKRDIGPVNACRDARSVIDPARNVQRMFKPFGGLAVFAFGEIGLAEMVVEIELDDVRRAREIVRAELFALQRLAFIQLRGPQAFFDRLVELAQGEIAVRAVTAQLGRVREFLDPLGIDVDRFLVIALIGKHAAVPGGGVRRDFRVIGGLRVGSDAGEGFRIGEVFGGAGFGVKLFAEQRIRLIGVPLRLGKRRRAEACRQSGDAECLQD